MRCKHDLIMRRHIKMNELSIIHILKVKEMITRRKKLIRIALLPLIGILLFFAFRIDIRIAEYDIKHEKITEPFTIALIADLHSCDYGEGQKELLTKLYFEEPDIVLLAGDIIDDKSPQDKGKEFLSAVSKKYPTYYVSGNHEFWSNDVTAIKKMIRDYGIPVLEGVCIPIEIRGQTINLCGIDDPEVGEREFSRQLDACSKTANKNRFSILLTHRPERISKYLPYDFDLILAGHTHGGQWRIPGILNGLLAPHQGLFPPHAGGLYEFEDKTMIVSRGLAKESTRIPRIFNRPEIVIIKVQPK